MTQDRTVQQVHATLPIPRKHAVGVFDSWQEGEKAVQALVDAGYPAQDIVLIPGQDFRAALQEHVRKEGRFRHLLHQLQITTDEGSLGELLEAAARQGSHIIAIYVPQRERVADVSAILFKHGARLVKYIGNWSVEDLFPPGQEASVGAEASRGVGDEPGSEDQQPGQAGQPSNATRSEDWGREQALRSEENVSAEAPTGMGDEPEPDNQQPGQALQPPAATRAPDWGSEQALRSMAAEFTWLFVTAARSAHGDAEKQGQLHAFFERSRIELSKFIDGSSQQINTAQDEQEGQEMNIEQAHQSNTDQYTGKPGVEAPSFGQDPGSAYGYDLDLATSID